MRKEEEEEKEMRFMLFFFCYMRGLCAVSGVLWEEEKRQCKDFNVSSRRKQQKDGKFLQDKTSRNKLMLQYQKKKKKML